MDLRHTVVVVVLGCGDNRAAHLDASKDSSTVDSAIGDGVDQDGPPGPPVTCTTTWQAGVVSHAYGIDDAGNIAGWWAAGNGEVHAFRKNALDASATDLGTLGGGYSVAYGISHEYTVGVAEVAPGDNRGFISDATGMHLAPLDHVYGVNASGVAVGDVSVSGTAHAMKYDHGVVTDLGTPAGRRNSVAFAINDNGVIVGVAYDGGANQQYNEEAVMWANGTITTLPAAPNPAVNAAIPISINAAGDTVVAVNSAIRGGTATALGIPDGFESCLSAAGWVSGVNDAGWIVGGVNCTKSLEGNDAFSHASIYVHDQPWDMAGLGTGANWAVAINNAGQIAGNVGYPFRLNDSTAVLITCVPVP